MMALTAEDMFYRSRFPEGLKFIICLLYVPAGCILALLRLFIGFQAFLAATILPKTFFLRRWVLRVMCTVLGVVVTSEHPPEENRPRRERSLIVANSVSVFDHLVLELMTPNFVLINKPCDGFVSWLHGYFAPQDSRISVKESIDHFFRDFSTDLVAFPEGTMTNGRGMMALQEWPFELKMTIRPVVIKIYRPTLNIAVTLLDSQSWQDVFWHLFTPITMYRIRFLPSERQQENESTVDFSRRIQRLMCESSDMITTNFTISDKRELLKRERFEEKRATVVQSTPPRDDRLTLMCRQVKDVLPDVPVNVIERDLRTTMDVDVTITNLLEGVTHYIPESQQKHDNSPVAAKSVIAVPVKSFSKSPRDRHISLAERKQQLIEQARAKYLEKYGSQNS